MEFGSQMALIANIIAAVGGVTGMLALVIAFRAEGRASRAVQASAEAQHRGLWTELIFSVQGILGANVVYDKLHPVLVRIRTAMSEVVDGAPKEQRDVLARWFSAQHRALNLLLERASNELETVPLALENIEKAHRGANEWAQMWVHNLRVARDYEGRAELLVELNQRAEEAEVTAEKLWKERENRGTTRGTTGA